MRLTCKSFARIISPCPPCTFPGYKVERNRNYQKNLEKWHAAIALFLKFNLAEDPVEAKAIYDRMLKSTLYIKINEKMAWNFVRQLASAAEKKWRENHQLGDSYETNWQNGKILTFIH